jgi:hypothetical protein
MRQRESTDRQSDAVEGQQTIRKPYQKPAVRYEKVFETSALTCGKVQTTQASCHFNRKTS